MSNEPYYCPECDAPEGQCIDTCSVDARARVREVEAENAKLEARVRELEAVVVEAVRCGNEDGIYCGCWHGNLKAAQETP